jgi:hypothetical protein
MGSKTMRQVVMAGAFLLLSAALHSQQQRDVDDGDFWREMPRMGRNLYVLAYSTGVSRGAENRSRALPGPAAPSVRGVMPNSSKATITGRQKGNIAPADGV